jgi:hypothetical protein
MKKSLYFLFLSLIIFDCSNEQIDDNLINNTQFNIIGKVFAPNGLDPISKAKISIISDENGVQETTSDFKGDFSIQLDYGDYELIINKGLFKEVFSISLNEQSDSFSFDLGDIILGQIPNIGVVTGHYDNIQSILYDIGLVNPDDDSVLFDIIDGVNYNRNNIENLKHNHRLKQKNDGLETNVDFNFSELLNDESLLNQYDILFLNCGLNTEEAETSEALFNFVNNGGILYATDWAYPFLEKINELSNNDFLTFQQPYQSGESLETQATILSSELNDWLSLNFNLTIENTVFIDEFLNSWQVVESYNTNSVIAWLNGFVEYNNADGELVGEEKELAFTYIVGDGGVFYSSFHTENNEQGFSCVDRIMEYMVFELSTLID